MFLLWLALFRVIYAAPSSIFVIPLSYAANRFRAMSGPVLMDEFTFLASPNSTAYFAVGAFPYLLQQRYSSQVEYNLGACDAVDNRCNCFRWQTVVEGGGRITAVVESRSINAIIEIKTGTHTGDTVCTNVSLMLASSPDVLGHFLPSGISAILAASTVLVAGKVAGEQMMLPGLIRDFCNRQEIQYTGLDSLYSMDLTGVSVKSQICISSIDDYGGGAEFDRLRRQSEYATIGVVLSCFVILISTVVCMVRNQG